MQLTLTSINFTPDPSAIPVPGPPWNANANSATTLVFAGGPLMPREGILINGNRPFGSPPPPTASVFNPFLQFEVHPNLLFMLTGVNSPAAPNCTATTTTGSCHILVAGVPSAYTITAIADGFSSVSIGIDGFATDGIGSAPWTGAFSGVVAMSPAKILLSLCPTGTCTAADVALGNVVNVASVSGSIATAASGGGNGCAAPVISGAAATPSVLWPPTGQLVPVTVNYTVTSDCAATSSLSVTSNESSARTQVVDAHDLLLAAARDGNGKGRTYTITITATNSTGTDTKTVSVLVPHDQSK
jgi:hypothetical protein